MDILLGAEIRFPQNDCDYLIYGFAEAELLSPEFCNVQETDIHSFFRRFQHKLLIIQAHPYRDGNTFVPAGCLHGVEVFNANLRHCNHNEAALQLAEQHALLQTAGSDAHRIEDIGRSGLRFATRMQTVEQLIAGIRGHQSKIVIPHENAAG